MKVKILEKVIAARTKPEYPGERNGFRLIPGEEVEVLGKTKIMIYRGTFITFYELGDGRGWIFDVLPKKVSTSEDTKTLNFKPGQLGITFTSGGRTVKRVVPCSQAYDLGVQGNWVVTKVDGVEVNDQSFLRRAKAVIANAHEAGEQYSITFDIVTSRKNLRLLQIVKKRPVERPRIRRLSDSMPDALHIAQLEEIEAFKMKVMAESTPQELVAMEVIEEVGDEDFNILESVLPLGRKQWQKGSRLEVFSVSKKQWFPAHIISCSDRTLKVKWYTGKLTRNNPTEMFAYETYEKNVGRYQSHVRPIVSRSERLYVAEFEYDGHKAISYVRIQFAVEEEFRTVPFGHPEGITGAGVDTNNCIFLVNGTVEATIKGRRWRFDLLVGGEPTVHAYGSDKAVGETTFRVTGKWSCLTATGTFTLTPEELWHCEEAARRRSDFIGVPSEADDSPKMIKFGPRVKNARQKKKRRHKRDGSKFTGMVSPMAFDEEEKSFIDDTFSEKRFIETRKDEEKRFIDEEEKLFTDTLGITWRYDVETLKRFEPDYFGDSYNWSFQVPRSSTAGSLTMEVDEQVPKLSKSSFSKPKTDGETMVCSVVDVMGGLKEFIEVEAVKPPEDSVQPQKTTAGSQEPEELVDILRRNAASTPEPEGLVGILPGEISNCPQPSTSTNCGSPLSPEPMVESTNKHASTINFGSLDPEVTTVAEKLDPIDGKAAEDPTGATGKRRSSTQSTERLWKGEARSNRSSIQSTEDPTSENYNPYAANDAAAPAHRPDDSKKHALGEVMNHAEPPQMGGGGSATVEPITQNEKRAAANWNPPGSLAPFWADDMTELDRIFSQRKKRSGISGRHPSGKKSCSTGWLPSSADTRTAQRKAAKRKRETKGWLYEMRAKLKQTGFPAVQFPKRDKT